jgi:hypothetical protein
VATTGLNSAKEKRNAKRNRMKKFHPLAIASVLRQIHSIIPAA